MSPETLCSLRIYLRRGERVGRGAGWFSRLFGRSLPAVLMEDALRAGLLYASVGNGRRGFGPQGTYVASEVLAEYTGEDLPVCVEVVGPKEQLDAFVLRHKPQLGRALVVRFDGAVLLSPRAKVDASVA